MLKLYVVRHGQTEHNLQGIIQGHVDTALNDEGRLQAEAVALALQRVHFDLAFCSDLSRAKDTAVAIVSKQRDPKPILQEDQRLRERDMGELSNTRGPVPRPMPKSVETSSHFVKRCLNWFESCIVPLARSDRELTVLATSHGAYIITLFRMLITPSEQGGLGYKIKGSMSPMNHCGNTSIAIVTVGSDGHGQVELFNDQSHLAATPDPLRVADASPFVHH